MPRPRGRRPWTLEEWARVAAIVVGAIALIRFLQTTNSDARGAARAFVIRTVRDSLPCCKERP